MLSFTTLRKTEQGWEFENEAALENFVWTNLEHLLKLTPLKQQYSVKGERCDILAVDKNKRLVVLELKNLEDRYIVQQLTRYCDNLQEEKPVDIEVDYALPIRLVAVAPRFHRHNFIDKKHHKLDFEFLLFEILQEGKKLYFNLKNIDSGQEAKVILPYPEEYLIDPYENSLPVPLLPQPPKTLLKSLEKDSSDKQNIILNIREKILRFDKHMQEKITATTITYGVDKSKGKLHEAKVCAELYSYKGEFPLNLFLWLPYPRRRRQGAFYQGFTQGIAMWRVFTSDWKSVSNLSLFLGKTGSVPPTARCSGNYDIKVYLNMYKDLTGKDVKSESLAALVDIALEEWLERLN